MSAVLALKRNSSTVRYCFEADAEPAVLPRALELLAKRGLVPARVFAQADADMLSVEIEVEGLEPATADHVGRCLGKIGTGEQDRLDTVAPLQLARDAPQRGSVVGIGPLGVEDSLIGLADQRDL